MSSYVLGLKIRTVPEEVVPLGNRVTEERLLICKYTILLSKYHAQLRMKHNPVCTQRRVSVHTISNAMDVV